MNPEKLQNLRRVVRERSGKKLKKYVKRSPQRDKIFIQKIRAGLPFMTACAAAGYSKKAVYDRMRKDEAFKDQYYEAQELYDDTLEIEADRRAVQGVRKPIWYKGERIGYERQYSDSLLLKRLQATKPHKYKDQQAIEFEGTLKQTHSASNELIKRLEAMRSKDD